jgi:phage repressor protein C with HTH and peptisase S24 domain
MFPTVVLGVFLPIALENAMSYIERMRLQAEDFWRALDSIARDRGLTASALARKAGLDPTTFNRSKRGGLRGTGRWPATSSIALVLEATDMTLGEFALLVEQPEMHPPAAAPLDGHRRRGASAAL